MIHAVSARAEMNSSSLTLESLPLCSAHCFRFIENKGTEERVK